MHYLMFQFLHMDPRNFSKSEATRNYKKILRVIHPDKNKSEYAGIVTQYVIQAYQTLTDISKRLYYMQHGRTIDSDYDREEAKRCLEHLHDMLVEYQLKKTKGAREDHDQEPSEHNEPSRRVDDSDRPFDNHQEQRQNQANTSDPRPSFSNVDESDSPGFKASSSEGSKKGSADKKARRSSNVSFGQTSFYSYFKSRDPDSNSDPSRDQVPKSGGSDKESTKENSEPVTPPKSPEVVVIDSDDDETAPQENSSDSPRNRRDSSPNKSSQDQPQSVPSSSDEESEFIKNLHKSQARPRAPRMSTPDSPSDSDHASVTSSRHSTPSTRRANRASTSPVVKIYADASTSPIKFDEGMPCYCSCHKDASGPKSKTDSRDAAGSRKTPSDPEHVFANPRRKSFMPRSSPGGQDFDYDFSMPEYSARRQFITSIKNLRTRSGKVLFTVCWGPHGEERTESAVTVIRERSALRRWLINMRLDRPKQFRAIMKHHADFGVVLGEPGDDDPLPSRRNETLD